MTTSVLQMKRLRRREDEVLALKTIKAQGDKQGFEKRQFVPELML